MRGGVGTVATKEEVAEEAVPPSQRARHVVLAGVLGAAAVVEFLFVTAGSGKNAILTVAKFFGLHAALLLIVQLTLAARLPWLDHRIGMDRLTVWHRWTGFALFWVIVTHALLILMGYAALYDMSIGATFLSLAGVPASLFGMIAAALIVSVGALSLRRVRRRLRYEVWHGLHLLTYVAFSFAFVHQLLETTTFASSAWAMAFWWAMWIFAVGSLVVGRVVRPLRRNAFHRFRVAEVVPEQGNAVSVYVTGRHLDRLPARAGQFAIWRFPGRRHWWLANPFSLSAAPNGHYLRLTAKSVGDGSAALRRLEPGDRAFLEGPYGAFTSLHRIRDKSLLIAGGIGITPIRSLLEEEMGDAVVLYRVRTEQDAPLLGEVRDLVQRKGGRLELLTGRTTDGNRPFTPERLRELVPDVTQRDVYVCGPTAMTKTVIRTLRSLDVPAAQIHAERFGLA